MSESHAVEVLEPGVLTSIQTPLGRRAWRHLGVPVGGAADPWSARLANRLVGNADDAPLLEATVSGPTLELGHASLVAVTGAPWPSTLDGLPLPPNVARVTRAGSILRVGSGDGARAYVAIGGLAADAVLGSAATDLRLGFGGHEGRALRAGDRLTVLPHDAQPMRWRATRPPSAGPVRIVEGPHADESTLAAVTAGDWRVADEADRAGVRLDGRGLGRHAGEVPSMGLPLGAIQLPPDGRPIVMLADHPVTGGYRVPACVIGADIGRVAQLRPGDQVRFERTTIDAAVTALRAMELSLDDLEPITPTADEDVDWAGSLG